MKDKYLPIGSIVSIKESNKLIMIVGYYAIKYQNVVKMYDYMGVNYPEGTLLDGTLAFNHDDITEIVFEGFKNESFNILNNNILGQNDKNTTNYNQKDNFVNIKYDNNGVVAYDEEEILTDSKSVAELVKLLKAKSVKNPFETADTIDVAPSAVPVIEQGTTTESSDSKAVIDKQNIEDNLNIALEKEEEQKDAAEEMETVKIEIPNYKFTEDGIIFND